MNNVILGDDPNRKPADKAYEKDVVNNINNSVKEMIQQNNSSIEKLDLEPQLKRTKTYVVERPAI